MRGLSLVTTLVTILPGQKLDAAHKIRLKQSTFVSYPFTRNTAVSEDWSGNNLSPNEIMVKMEVKTER